LSWQAATMSQPGEHGRTDRLAEVFHLNRGSSSSLPPKA
jgi:hypothetical protein